MQKANLKYLSRVLVESPTAVWSNIATVKIWSPSTLNRNNAQSKRYNNCFQHHFELPVLSAFGN